MAHRDPRRAVPVLISETGTLHVLMSQHVPLLISQMLVLGTQRHRRVKDVHLAGRFNAITVQLCTTQPTLSRTHRCDGKTSGIDGISGTSTSSGAGQQSPWGNFGIQGVISKH